MLHWRKLESIHQFEELLNSSGQNPFAIFKHSTRCSVSSMAKKKMEFEWDFTDETMPIYYLDLLQHRDVSNKIASDLNIIHQSPQLIVVKNKKTIYHESHGNIELNEIRI